MIKNKKGFTLIELIIVMAIIGILAVVAIVAISGKTADARDARRLADMSAIRTAMAISCADDDADVALTGNTSLQPVVCKTTGSNNLNFSNIYDPIDTSFDPATDCAVASSGCANNASGTCNYSWGQPDAGVGAAWGVGNAPTTIDPCNYWVNFYTEGGDGVGAAHENGLTL